MAILYLSPMVNAKDRVGFYSSARSMKIARGSKGHVADCNTQQRRPCLHELFVSPRGALSWLVPEQGAVSMPAQFHAAQVPRHSAFRGSLNARIASLWMSQIGASLQFYQTTKRGRATLHFGSTFGSHGEVVMLQALCRTSGLGTCPISRSSMPAATSLAVTCLTPGARMGRPFPSCSSWMWPTTRLVARCPVCGVPMAASTTSSEWLHAP